MEDRIVLNENTSKKEAISLIKRLPQTTPKENRHKYVFTIDKNLIIGRADKGNPRHRNLGDVKRDKIAGYICFVFDDYLEDIIEVYLNNQSKDFDYPRFELLKEPQLFITNLFGPVSIDMEDIPIPTSKLIDLSDLTTH